MCDFMLDNIKSNVLRIGCSWRLAEHCYSYCQIQMKSESIVNHTPAPSTAEYKLFSAICQQFQQYIKKGRAFTEMLPWNIIIATWVLKLLIKSPSTVYSQCACCADLGASLTDPGYPAHTCLISVVMAKMKHKYYPLQKCVWYHFQNQIRQIVSASLANVNPHSSDLCRLYSAGWMLHWFMISIQIIPVEYLCILGLCVCVCAGAM